MRNISVIVIALLVAVTSAVAEKAPYDYPQMVPQIERQGGDTISQATEIDLGTSVSGTTMGYSDDYDEICDFVNPGAPDVVYVFWPGMCQNGWVEANLCSSEYDTKLYVYESDENNLVACNDDYCPGYMSELSFESGQPIYIDPEHRYYFVVDGYSPGDMGDYTLELSLLYGSTPTQASNFSIVKGLYR